MRDFVFRVEQLVSKLATKVSDLLNSAHEDSKESGGQSADDDAPLQLQIISSNGMSQCTLTSAPARPSLLFTFLCVTLNPGRAWP
jgi:hypothetical protein